MENEESLTYQPEVFLTIKRKETDLLSSQGSMKKMNVIVDGNKKYKLGHGEQIEVPLEYGQHTIQSELLWSKKKITISIPEDMYLENSFENEGVRICDPNKQEDFPINSGEKEIKIHSGQEKQKVKSENQGKERIEIICPFCGSNQVTKTTLPNPALFFVYFLLFGGVAFFVNGMKWLFALISIGSLIFSLIFLLARQGEKKQNFWTIHCDTCNKNFNIDIPDGSVVITNLKSDDN